MDALVELGRSKLTAQSRTLGETSIAIKQSEEMGIFLPEEPHQNIALKVLEEHSGLPVREQAKILSELLGGAKTQEACRSLLRRLKGTLEE
jgi:hypothetical protein